MSNNQDQEQLMEEYEQSGGGEVSIPQESNDDNYVYEISIYVDGIDQLDKIITTLNNKKYIENVERAFK